MSLYDVKRNELGELTEICPVTLSCKVGSIECTKDCKFNKNTPKEIQHYAFELPKVRCYQIVELFRQKEPKQSKINF